MDAGDTEERKAFLRDVCLPLAIRRSTESQELATALLAGGHRSPAFVWAVRAAEIFFRDGLLFALEYEKTGDVDAAAEAAKAVIGGGKWTRTVRTIREAYGLEEPEHDMVTEGGEDAWVCWGRDGVARRHDVVHGRDEIDDDETVEWAIAFVEQLRKSFTLRAIASDRGPFADVLRSVIEQAQEAYRREREESSD